MESRPTRAVARAALAVGFVAMFAGFIALGIWQVQRLGWKLDLIQRVESRVHASPVAAPGPADWPRVTAARDEYRHVALAGHFLDGRDTRVQAVTAVGPGFWLIRPLRLADGSTVLVNRGFVPPGWQAPNTTTGAVPVTVTGLLRLTEPEGGFLRSNAPASDRWYSRDVPAIAAARGLDRVAPYFIDADRAATATGVESGYPRGGLTVVRFHNNHLVYALTWFGLALMTAAAAWRVTLEQRRRDRLQEPHAHAPDSDDRPNA